MNIKKTLCIILAAITVTCACASCGDKNSDSDKGGDKAQTATETVDVTAVADKMKSDITFEDSLVEFDSDKINKILGVSADSYKTAKVYVSSTGATPEEIGCFEANSEEMATSIEAALTMRLNNQKGTFTDYKPEQAPKLDDAVLVVKGTYVYYCVSGDSAKAKEIIG